MRTGETLARNGNLAVRLARDPADISAAQRLRYHVFYEELRAKPDAEARENRRDADRFDGICDHLLVVCDPPPRGHEPVLVEDGELVGTYRVLRQSVAKSHGGFYTQDEYDLTPLLARHRKLKFLELGRSCVLKRFRTRPVIELLWQGIWNYVRAHGLDVMMGCASFEGTEPGAHALPLTFLARHCLSPPEWRVRAQPARYVAMDRLPPGAIDTKGALKTMPPLIKGYLRLGCSIGEGAVIDPQFNTVDVLIMLPVSAIDPRYFERFGAPGEVPAA